MMSNNVINGNIDNLTPSGGFGFRENFEPPGAHGTAHLEIKYQTGYIIAITLWENVYYKAANHTIQRFLLNKIGKKF